MPNYLSRNSFNVNIRRLYVIFKKESAPGDKELQFLDAFYDQLHDWSDEAFAEAVTVWIRSGGRFPTIADLISVKSQAYGNAERKRVSEKKPDGLPCEYCGDSGQTTAIRKNPADGSLIETAKACPFCPEGVVFKGVLVRHGANPNLTEEEYHWLKYQDYRFWDEEEQQIVSRIDNAINPAAARVQEACLAGWRESHQIEMETPATGNVAREVQRFVADYGKMATADMNINVLPRRM